MLSIKNRERKGKKEERRKEEKEKVKIEEGGLARLVADQVAADGLAQREAVVEMGDKWGVSLVESGGSRG